ncbi:MAG: YkgJ family cysteine cluster protein [Desulfonatronovibrio sp.]
MKQVFNCTMCGECCQGEGGIVATLDEQISMAAFLGLELDNFQAKYIRKSGEKFFVRTGSDKLCLFFAQGKGCLVHPVKPGPCRAWPFFRGNLMDESSFEMARQYCAGINKQVCFDEFVRQGIDYLEQHKLSGELNPSPANALNIQGIKG